MSCSSLHSCRHTVFDYGNRLIGLHQALTQIPTAHTETTGRLPASLAHHTEMIHERTQSQTMKSSLQKSFSKISVATAEHRKSLCYNLDWSNRFYRCKHNTSRYWQGSLLTCWWVRHWTVWYCLTQYVLVQHVHIRCTSLWLCAAFQ